MANKPLPKGPLAHARRIAKRIVQKDFGGNVSCAAAVIGLGTATLAHFVRGKQGIGIHGLVKLAEYTNLALDDLIGRKRK